MSVIKEINKEINIIRDRIAFEQVRLVFNHPESETGTPEYVNGSAAEFAACGRALMEVAEKLKM
jgi:hypothetical protein